MDIRVYCINLKERPDRWARFIQQPGIQQLTQQYPFERFEAVNGKKLDIAKDDRVSIRTKRNILYQKRRDHEDLDTAGGVGCYLSHKGCWDKFLASGAQAALIFEDDAEVKPDFASTFQKCLGDLGQIEGGQPDIWILSNVFTFLAMDLQPVQYNGKWAFGITGPLQCYMIWPQGAKALSENAFPIDGHVDHFMHRCSQLGLVKMAHHKDMIVKQVHVKKNDSDIREKPRCEVCDIPFSPSDKGFLILSKQQTNTLLLGAIMVGALGLLSQMGRKK